MAKSDKVAHTVTPRLLDECCGDQLRRRVVRGGSWNNNPNNLRAANRNRNNPQNRNNNLGFRLVSHGLHLSAYWAGYGLSSANRGPVQLIPGRAWAPDGSGPGRANREGACTLAVSELTAGLVQARLPILNIPFPFHKRAVL